MYKQLAIGGLLAGGLVARQLRTAESNALTNLVLVSAAAALGVVTIQTNDFIRGSKTYFELADEMVPLMRKLDPENAHNLSISLLENDLHPYDLSINDLKSEELKLKNPIYQKLSSEVFGIEFTNPVGLAAGYDKQAVVMPQIHELGFGFMEIGGVTPVAQIGNEKPRMFRLEEDLGIINRFGLNSDGHVKISKRLEEYNLNKKESFHVVGVNLAKNSTTKQTDTARDYMKGVLTLGPHVDFIVLNISCPNVAWTKELSKDTKEIQNLIHDVKAIMVEELENPIPLLVKLSPDMDLSGKKEMAKLLLKEKVDGIILTNTTSSRPEFLKSAAKQETGGLSGEPLRELSKESLKDMYKLTKGKIPIISVGGISNGKEAYERIKLGASLVQVYSGLVYKGPSLVKKIKEEMIELLDEDGFENISQAVGVDNLY